MGPVGGGQNRAAMSPTDPIRASFDEALATLQAFLADPSHLQTVSAFAEAAHGTLRSGGVLMSCGNGGQHVRRDALRRGVDRAVSAADRSALPALAFSDPSQLTCISNDFGYDEVFARHVEAHGKPGDLLVALSTSGNSPNILRACEVARERQGPHRRPARARGAASCEDRVDIPIVVPMPPAPRTGSRKCTSRCCTS